MTISISALIYWAIMGIVVGFIASLFSGNKGGLFFYMIIGILGSILGGWLAGILGPILGFTIAEGFNAANIGVSVGGALIILAIFGGFGRK